MENNINLNQSACLKETKNFTHTLVTNVCNGETSQVPYGSMDVLLGGFFIFLFLGLLIIFGGLLMSVYE